MVPFPESESKNHNRLVSDKLLDLYAKPDAGLWGYS